MQDGRQAARIPLETGVGRVEIDPEVGNLRALFFEFGGRRLEPLHTAPWVDDPDIIEDDTLLPVERRLSGDFFCAPFGASDVEAAPAHGWPANSRWDVAGQTDGEATLQLARQVMGARITKTLRLAEDGPLLYQVHRIEGGTGELTVAHHPMVRMAGTARFSCSPKLAVLTPDTLLESGRNRLAGSSRSETLSAVPGSDGAPIDLTMLPIADAHEDFVTLVEGPGSPLGWSVVLRHAEDDIVFVLKDPGVLPVTMLWHSNGGRDYRPWNGRHRGVLGIEDGCAAGAEGHAAALLPNPVSREGVATALVLAPDRTHRIAHVIGAVPRPPFWQCVDTIAVGAGTLTLTGDTGESLELTFDTDFFAGSG